MRWTNATRVLGLSALLAMGMPFVVHAQVYRCTGADGSVAYQDHACTRGQKQRIIDVPSRPPSGYVPPSPSTAALPGSAADVATAQAHVPPPSSLPMLYACVGAVNGKRYLARQPPPPYLAPLGVMGYPPQSLSQVYGRQGGGGVSAPEVAPRPRVGGPSIAAGLTEVQDACMPAPQAEVCSYVQREYDDNHRKLRMALRNEQPPLRQREDELQDQLRNCR